MISGSFIFALTMEHLPWPIFQQCATRYGGNKHVKAFICSDQYRFMAFAQLNYRSSLRDIETCLRTQATKLRHMGIRDEILRNALGSANQDRDWRIAVEFAQNLIHFARAMHADDALSGLNIDEPVYALESVTIHLCHSLSLWAQFRKTKGAIKPHAFLHLHGNMPTFLHIFIENRMTKIFWITCHRKLEHSKSWIAPILIWSAFTACISLDNFAN